MSTSTEQIRSAIERDPDIEATDLDIALGKDGDVILRGWVEDVTSKRQAETIAAKLAAPATVKNELRVRPPSGETGDFAAERAPLENEFGSKKKADITARIDNDDKFNGDGR